MIARYRVLLWGPHNVNAELLNTGCISELIVSRINCPKFQSNRYIHKPDTDEAANLPKRQDFKPWTNRVNLCAI